MPVADADAIRRAVDSPIGENLTCPCASGDRRSPVDTKACFALREPQSPSPATEKHTSKATEACVLNANEEKRSIFASAPYHGLCVGSDVTGGALLRGSSREPVSGAPAEIVCSRRAVDCAARPKR
jgi:hypothetical protein